MKATLVKNGKEYTLRVNSDENHGESPFANYSGDIAFVSNHRGYSDDNNEKYSHSLDDCIDGMEEFTCVPVYALIHSGISVSLTPFSCRWDSGVFGFLVFPNERKDEFDTQFLTSLVNEWNMIFNGEVYWYSLTVAEICQCCNHAGEEEEIDKLGGIFASDYAELKEGIRVNIPLDDKELVEELLKNLN